jgi:hypothetical protein
MIRSLVLVFVLISFNALAVQVTLTDVERVETGSTAQCIYTGHNITRTVEVRGNQNCKAAMSFETDE